jgi:hypothetical protein
VRSDREATPAKFNHHSKFGRIDVSCQWFARSQYNEERSTRSQNITTRVVRSVSGRELPRTCLTSEVQKEV